MPTALKSEGELIKIKQYLTDKKGHKVAAVIAMDELDRLETLLETIPSILIPKPKTSGT